MTRTTETSSETLDALLTALADARRRNVVRYFADNRGPVPLGDLADAVAAMETDRPSPASVRCSLRHVHLPVLESAGVVRADRARGLVEPTASATEFDRVRSLTDTLAAAR